MIIKIDDITNILPGIMVKDDNGGNQYEQYEHTSCNDDSTVHLFTARRRGRGHIAKGQACQDFAMNAGMKYGVILCAADGLGSCDHSDQGSRFACESAVSIITELSEKTKSESVFIKKLAKVFTRKRIVMDWMDRIHKNAGEEYGTDDLYKCCQEYNSTLMVAVITEHYIYAMNIGDGQVLLFNHEYAYGLRPASKKESSMTDSLLDPRSWAEGFQTCLFPREYFSGVLLSTDGIYDFLNKGQSFHVYALQAAERFVSAGKPAFPFDYMTEDGKIHHIYDSGSFDDCTIQMAVFMKPVLADSVHEYISSEFEKNAIDRMSRNIRRYHVLHNHQESVLIVSPEVYDFSTDLAEVLQPYECTEYRNHYYSLYHSVPFTSLEQMYASGKFNMNRMSDTKDLLNISIIYEKLKRLADELAEHHLKLNEGAGFLCGFDESSSLILCKDAISVMDQERPGERYCAFNSFFRNIHGFLIFENRKLPVFRGGLTDASNRLVWIDGLMHGTLGFIRQTGTLFELVNMSQKAWTGGLGEMINVGESLILDGEISFNIQARRDIRLTYHFMKKEDL